MQKYQHTKNSTLSVIFSNVLTRIKPFFRAVGSAVGKLKGGIGRWFRLHFADDINSVRGFFEGVKRADNKLISEIKLVGASFAKFGKTVKGIFTKASRSRIAAAAKRKLDAVNSKVEEHGFFPWLANSILVHKRFIGVVAIALSAVVFMSVYSENAYAMNCVAVVVNGENLGNVANIEAFDESVRLVEERVSVGTNGEYKLGLDIKYEFNSAPDEEISTTNEMIDKILRFSGTSIVDAYGLYVDGELWAVCRDKETIDNVINGMIKPYQDKETDKDAVVRFVQNTETVYGLYPAGLLCSEEDLKLIIGNTEGYKSYRVQQGDTVESIAMMNDTTVDEIRAINPGLPDELVVGSDINVLNNEAKLTVQTVIRKTYEKKIAYKTEKTRTKSLTAGTTKVEQKGENGLKRITSDFIYMDGELADEIIVESVTVKQPVTEKVLVGTKSAGGGGGASTGNYMRPVSGGYISSKYGYRGREFHTGVDIAAPKGTPIMAADGGTVASVVYSGSGYGYHVIINHSNGEQTLYGHCSAIYVSVGEKVDKGQVIAAVGQTGRAYGYHCHFEVRRNGKHVYPGI